MMHHLKMFIISLYTIDSFSFCNYSLQPSLQNTIYGVCYKLSFDKEGNCHISKVTHNIIQQKDFYVIKI